MMDDFVSHVSSVLGLAGEEVLKVYNSKFLFSTKGDNSPITRADLVSDEIIKKGLMKFGYPILSEESFDDKTRLNHERVWIVDSLDGTQDFIDKTGAFSIMIGLVENGLPVGGFVYLPVAGKLFFSKKGEGAFMQVGSEQARRRVYVTSQNVLSNASVLVSRTHFTDDMKRAVSLLKVKDVMHLGSNGVKMAAMLEGRADFFFNVSNKLGQWDCCALQVILEEAGGRVTGVKGERLIYNAEYALNPYGLVASNGILHESIVETLSNL